MRRTTIRQAARRGFTLVELMVAAALCVLIMYVMATAFKAGMDTLSELKSVASLAEQLRTADTIMRRDLGNDRKELPTDPNRFSGASHYYHLEDSTGRGVRVSDIGKSLVTSAGSPSPPGPLWNGASDYGFFKVVTNPSTPEGNDGIGIESALALNDWLHFTTKLNNDSANQATTFAAGAPPVFATSSTNMIDLAGSNDQYVSTWGEVLYFLAPSGQLTPDPDDAGPLASLPLYTLHRRIRVLARPTHIPAVVPASMIAGGIGFYPEVGLYDDGSSSVGIHPPGGARGVNDPANRMVGDIPASAPAPPTPLPTPPSTQVDPLKFPATSSYYGNDIVLTNVLSMKVQVMFDDIREVDPPDGSPPVVTSSPLYQDIPTAMRGKYDTFNNTSYTESGFKHTLRLRAIRIQLRIYDPKNLLTRQMTITQDL